QVGFFVGNIQIYYPELLLPKTLRCLIKFRIKKRQMLLIKAPIFSKNLNPLILQPITVNQIAIPVETILFITFKVTSTIIITVDIDNTIAFLIFTCGGTDDINCTPDSISN